MELQTAIEILEYHQEWRLGKKEDMIHEPKKLTEALDIVLNEVKKISLKPILEVVFPTKEDVLNEAEKQISDWLEGSTESEKEHYRVAFRRSYEYIIRITTK